MVERCGYAFYRLFALKLVAVVPEELISPRLREYEVSELDWVLLRSQGVSFVGFANGLAALN
jgi:hypothetical protein